MVSIECRDASGINVSMISILLQVGMVLPGSVKQIMSYGIFIEFISGIFGLAPNSVSVVFHTSFPKFKGV